MLLGTRVQSFVSSKTTVLISVLIIADIVYLIWNCDSGNTVGLLQCHWSNILHSGWSSRPWDGSCNDDIGVLSWEKEDSCSAGSCSCSCTRNTGGSQFGTACCWFTTEVETCVSVWYSVC